MAETRPRCHIANMAEIDAATCRAIRHAPVTQRELARRAGLSHNLPRLILSGERRATPAAATKLAEALEAIANEAAGLAKDLRQALG